MSPKIVKGQSPPHSTTLLPTAISSPPPPPPHPQPSFPMHPIPLLPLLLFILFLNHTAPFPLPNSTAFFLGCNQTISCGSIKNLSYPFTGGPRPARCGPPGFNLTCSNNNTTLELVTNSLSYRVIKLDSRAQTMTLSRSDLYNNNPTPCMPKFINTNLDSTIFTPTNSDNQNLTFFYGCRPLINSSYKPPNLLSCINNSTVAYYIVGPVPIDPVFKVIECNNASVTVPILSSAVDELVRNRSLLGEVLMEGFNVNYSVPQRDECAKCVDESGGVCGWLSGRAVCICDDRVCDTTGTLL